MLNTAQFINPAASLSYQTCTTSCNGFPVSWLYTDLLLRHDHINGQCLQPASDSVRGTPEVLTTDAIGQSRPRGCPLLCAASPFAGLRLMHRRHLVRTASVATLALVAARSGVSAQKTPPIAYGIIIIESSTYGDIRAHMDNVTILRAKIADESARSAVLKKCSHTTASLPAHPATFVGACFRRTA